jgi:hypothetical protein
LYLKNFFAGCGALLKKFIIFAKTEFFAKNGKNRDFLKISIFSLKFD